MKVIAHMRVSEYKGKARISASAKPNNQPFSQNDQPLPTAMFALELDIPDSRFHLAEQVLAEIKVAEEDTKVAANITYREE
jgi:hypothetical protein